MRVHWIFMSQCKNMILRNWSKKNFHERNETNIFIILYCIICSLYFYFMYDIHYIVLCEMIIFREYQEKNNRVNSSTIDGLKYFLTRFETVWRSTTHETVEIRAMLAESRRKACLLLPNELSFANADLFADSTRRLQNWPSLTLLTNKQSWYSTSGLDHRLLIKSTATTRNTQADLFTIVHMRSISTVPSYAIADGRQNR